MKRWYGKFFGLIAGWLLLRHPAGGLLGLLIGHAFDADWFKSTRDNPYRVFGLTEEASDAEIDLAYRRLISQYHPDRVAGAVLRLLHGGQGAGGGSPEVLLHSQTLVTHHHQHVLGSETRHRPQHVS